MNLFILDAIEDVLVCQPRLFNFRNGSVIAREAHMGVEINYCDDVVDVRHGLLIGKRQLDKIKANFVAILEVRGLVVRLISEALQNWIFPEEHVLVFLWALPKIDYRPWLSFLVHSESKRGVLLAL